MPQGSCAISKVLHYTYIGCRNLATHLHLLSPLLQFTSCSCWCLMVSHCPATSATVASPSSPERHQKHHQKHKEKHQHHYHNLLLLSEIAISYYQLWSFILPHLFDESPLLLTVVDIFLGPIPYTLQEKVLRKRLDIWRCTTKKAYIVDRKEVPR